MVAQTCLIVMLWVHGQSDLIFASLNSGSKRWGSQSLLLAD